MCSTKKQIDTWTLGDTIIADNFENSNKKNKWISHWSHAIGKYAERLETFQDIVVYF